jgi:hypothetical protein
MAVEPSIHVIFVVLVADRSSRSVLLHGFFQTVNVHDPAVLEEIADLQHSLFLYFLYFHVLLDPIFL